MKFIALNFFLLLLSFANAQIPEYYVYLVKGDIKIAHPKAKIVPLKQNSLVFKEDEFIVTKNSEVTLVNRDAKYIVINKQGKIKINDLGKSIHNSYTGVTEKYLKLLWHELLDPNYDYSKFKLQNIAGVYGGVSRGEENCENVIFPISGLKTSFDSLHFFWKKIDSINTYHMVIYDATGEKIFNKAVSDTQLIISLSKEGLIKNGKYVLSIKEPLSGCEEGTAHVFEILSKEQEQKIINGYKEPTSIDLLTQLQLIDKMEKNKLIYAAMAKYSSLIKLYPDNTLKKTYYDFLSHYGFITKAEDVFKSISIKKL
ncbi:MAG TPA: hypothetical protein VMY77_03990 [Chitinophagaceae bacterium]|nr:hypothetical protein [Chitinophagaceae bacterium]